MIQEFKRSEVIYSDDCIKFHKFSETGQRPIVLLPPYAGRYGSVEQNKIDALVANGRTVYCYELLPATIATGYKLDVAGLVNKIDLCVDLTGADKVNLAGDCQGGTLAAIYTSLHQDSVSKLSITCAPINTKTGQDNPIEKYSETASMAYHKLRVASNGGIQSGVDQYLAFLASNPVPVLWDRHVNQMFNILRCDWEKVEKQRNNDAWHDSPMDIHGGWFLEWLEHHFFNNEFYEGTWGLSDGSTPNLAGITCPVFLYQGGADPVTHPQQLLDIQNKISSTEIHTKVFEGEGHTGPFVKKGCLEYFINEFFAEETTH